MRPLHAFRRAGMPALLGLAIAGCDNMQHQENVRAFEPSDHFSDGASARIPPAHTVSRSDPAPDDAVATGGGPGAWKRGFPVALTREFVGRGRERYAIFCVECHGAEGGGRGIVVLRGFPQPPSFDVGRLRRESEGELFDAIGRGRGVMYGFADRIAPVDRWAIVAYVRALQRSRRASLADVPEAERRRLTGP